jgi:NCS1 family nucleobase:cation symporter-1
MAANEVTFSVNASDTTRYARKPNDALWPPLFFHPLATTIVALFGILVTSSSSVILGKVNTRRLMTENEAAN